MININSKKQEILKKLFGHNSFRQFQEEAIDTILQKRDLLTILPTGGGKSLCYQLPSLLMDGVTVIISPLIALMQDQVMAMQSNGISACMISSAQNNSEIETVYQKLLSNNLKLLYIAPERFTSNTFMGVLQRININFFVIDEAHCVSEWGHEFRGEYRNLNRLKQMFPNIAITAFTATATKKVQNDIISALRLQDPLLLRGETKRENLIIDVQKRAGNGRTQLINFLNLHKNECGIIYTFTRREAQSIANFLQEKHFSAKAYHAGLSSQTRDEVYKEFLYEKINIVVATIAFGMGIDKSNIRFVVHMSMPKTMENYYQEIGRAGRDGLKSEVLLLSTKGDEIQRRVLIDDLDNNEYKSVMYHKLEQMYKYTISSKCRHKIIAAYFDDEIEECGNLCDNCVKGEVQKVDITVDAQKFLSAVYRCDQKFGQNHIIDLLRGSKNQKIFQFGHDNLSVYGIGKERSKDEWSAISDRLFDVNAISLGEHRILKLEPKGFNILQKKATLEIDEDNFGKVYKAIDTKILSCDDEFYENFRELRKKIAKEENVPAYVVFSDKTLVQLSEKLPQTKDEMLQIHGIGEVKFEKYGDPFLLLCIKLKPEANKRPKKLTDTYFKTLELIESGNDINQAAQQREMQAATIMGHIKLLNEHKKIDDDKKERLFAKVADEFPDNIKLWCEEGLKFEEIKKLREYLAMYEYFISNKT